MPSSVSGEPNTTPFSAEQKIMCSDSAEPSSHRDEWSPKNGISACKDQCPKMLRVKVTRLPQRCEISQALIKSLHLTTLYLQRLHLLASYLSLITVFIS